MEQIRFSKHIQQYAVMLLLHRRKGEDHLLFQIRNRHMKRQPGEIGFPGGGIEEGENSLQAALRECEEELFLQPSEIEIIEPLEIQMAPFNMVIHPWLGRILEEDRPMDFNPDEVDHLLYVPVDFFLKRPPEYHEGKLTVQHGENFPLPNYDFRTAIYPIYFYYYGHYVIWGLSARMLYDALPQIKKHRR